MLKRRFSGLAVIAAALAAVMPMMPGTAHAVHLEKPSLFHALVEDFVGG